MKTLTLGLIRFYQLTLGGRSGILAILVGGGCRHSLTCSEYTVQMIKKFGVRKGIILGANRIWNCR